MTVKKAKELLKTANVSEKPSKLNPTFTCAQFVKIIQDGLESYEEKNGEDFVLSHLFEKRVYQAIRNQRRPRF